MSGAKHGHGGPEPLEVEDPKTGERYLMYPVPWPDAVVFVYQCPTCHGSFPTHQWTSGCPGCCGHKKKGKKRRHGC